MEKTKRKIIEIYATENKEEDSISFDIEKIEDSDVANYTMTMLLKAFSIHKSDNESLEIEVED